MPSPRKIALWIGALIVAGAAGVVLFAASGLYNVAASSGHLAVTDWFLRFGMQRSVATHSLPISSPPLDNPDMVRLGAAHFQNGCALCHGAPGQRPAEVLQKSLPEPPSLGQAAANWTPEQLFWIVKHGLKYTAMPAWISQGRDDEVWAVVSFLLKLPNLSPEEYRSLANGGIPESQPEAREMAHLGADSVIAACARCHGDETTPPASRIVPKLAGLSQESLVLALRQYAEGVRHSGIMQTVAAELDDDEIQKLAAYYAAMPRSQGPASPAAIATPEQIERGTQIASTGIPQNDVPACLPCHNGAALPTYPRLEGQNGPYIAAQLKLWKQGLRADTPLGAIMAPIAQRLTEEEIADIAAYFESLPGPGGAKAARAP